MPRIAHNNVTLREGIPQEDRRECFNGVWEHLAMKKREAADDQNMLNLAHASRYHWGIVGTSKHQAIGDWQVSRTYAALGQPFLSLRFAKVSLETCERDGLHDILCTAYEAMARALTAGGQYKSARQYLARAKEALDASDSDSEDRAVYLDQIRDTEAIVRGWESWVMGSGPPTQTCNDSTVSADHTPNRPASRWFC